MRLTSFFLERSCLALFTCVGLALVAPTALAAPPATKAKAQPAETLPSTKADPSQVVRAASTKELPRALSAQDKKVIDAAVVELAADRPESAIATLRAWAKSATPRLSIDDTTMVAYWVFRQGVLAKGGPLADAADRLRFFDERFIALTDSRAQLRGAAASKRPVVIVKLVVPSPYVKDTRGDDRREKQVTRDELDSLIRDADARQDDAHKEREAARAAFSSLDADGQRRLTILTGLLYALK
jgi:hypothetical protein